MAKPPAKERKMAFSAILYINTVFSNKMFLPSNTLSIDRTIQAILHGRIITAQHEYIAGVLDRYRFLIAVKGSPIQELLITGLPGKSQPVPVVNRKELFKRLAPYGCPESIMKTLMKSDAEHLIHLIKGTWTSVKEGVCGVPLYYPIIRENELWAEQEAFEALSDYQQCPYCRNKIDWRYLPVQRFRKITYEQQTAGRQKKLPG